MNDQPRSAGDPGQPLLLWEVQQTARLVARRFEEAMRSAGVSTSEFGVLACVNDQPGITQAGVARQLDIRPQALTSTIDNLRGRGFIPGRSLGRGRRSDLTLTDAGRAALDAAWPSVIALNAPEALGMSPGEIEALCNRLAYLRQQLSCPDPEIRDRHFWSE